MHPPQRSLTCVSFGTEILSSPQEYFSVTAANSQTFRVTAIFSVTISHLLSDSYHLTKALLTTTGTPLAQNTLVFIRVAV